MGSRRKAGERCFLDFWKMYRGRGLLIPRGLGAVACWDGGGGVGELRMVQQLGWSWRLIQLSQTRGGSLWVSRRPTQCVGRQALVECGRHRQGLWRLGIFSPPRPGFGMRLSRVYTFDCDRKPRGPRAALDSQILKKFSFGVFFF